MKLLRYFGLFLVVFCHFLAFICHLPPICHHLETPINRAFQKVGGRVADKTRKCSRARDINEFTFFKNYLESITFLTIFATNYSNELKGVI